MKRLAIAAVGLALVVGLLVLQRSHGPSTASREHRAAAPSWHRAALLRVQQHCPLVPRWDGQPDGCAGGDPRRGGPGHVASQRRREQVRGFLSSGPTGQRPADREPVGRRVAVRGRGAVEHGLVVPSRARRQPLRERSRRPRSCLPTARAPSRQRLRHPTRRSTASTCTRRSAASN